MYWLSTQEGFKWALGLGGCDVPGQQLVDAVDGVIGDASEHLAQVRLRIESVEFGVADQGVDRCGTLTAGVGAGGR